MLMPTNVPMDSKPQVIRRAAYRFGLLLYLRILVLPVARLLVFVAHHSAPRGRLVWMVGVLYRWLAPR